MKKIILAIVTAVVATGSLVVEASARQPKRGDTHNATSAVEAKHAYGYASTNTGLFGRASEGIQPIPGSITYGGQPMTRLVKAPVGSSFDHEFNFGADRYSETYIIQADRSLKLASRNLKNQN
jgi:hypothetical protein